MVPAGWGVRAIWCVSEQANSSLALQALNPLSVPPAARMTDWEEAMGTGRAAAVPGRPVAEMVVMPQRRQHLNPKLKLEMLWPDALEARAHPTLTIPSRLAVAAVVGLQPKPEAAVAAERQRAARTCSRYAAPLAVAAAAVKEAPLNARQARRVAMGSLPCAGGKLRGLAPSHGCTSKGLSASFAGGLCHSGPLRPSPVLQNGLCLFAFKVRTT